MARQAHATAINDVEIDNDLPESIDDYIDRAKAAKGFRHDIELDRALGHLSHGVTHWRTKRSLPDEEKMRLLAEIAGINPSIALVQLAIWRSKTDALADAWRVWLNPKNKARALLLAGAIAVASSVTAPNPAQARTMPERTGLETRPVYIMENKKRRRSRGKEQPLAA